MVPSTVLTNIATLVAATSVVKRGPQDGLRRVKTTKDTVGRDREFILDTIGGPSYIDGIIGGPNRTMQIQLAIAYNATDGVMDRVSDDAQLITDVMETAMIDISGIEYSRVLDASYDGDSINGLVLLSIVSEIWFDTTA